jgi:hypothetical protein
MLAASCEHFTLSSRKAEIVPQQQKPQKRDILDGSAKAD